MIGRNCGRFASKVIASDWLVLDASLKSSFGCQRPVCMAAIINPHNNVMRLDIWTVYAIVTDSWYVIPRRTAESNPGEPCYVLETCSRGSLIFHAFKKSEQSSTFFDNLVGIPIFGNTLASCDPSNYRSIPVAFSLPCSPQPAHTMQIIVVSRDTINKSVYRTSILKLLDNQRMSGFNTF